ncbi:hypothetical protein HK104_008705 [Borealophlyctis nickersoniae]|nr:hypothetical protein HK104_008705 [Borealophlyctis nickersoniae]
MENVNQFIVKAAPEHQLADLPTLKFAYGRYEPIPNDINRRKHPKPITISSLLNPRELWERGTAKDFEVALKSYDLALKAVCIGKKKASSGHQLKELDEWGRTVLPELLRKRDEVVGSKGGRSWLEKEELVRIVNWIVLRGVYRPSKLRHSRMNRPELVREKTRRAYRILHYGNSVDPENQVFKPVPGYWDIINAVKVLCDGVRGVGPMAASAILNAYCPTIPFMSDEIVAVMPHLNGKKPQYTFEAYKALVKMLDAIAKRVGNGWTMATIEKAIWARAVCIRNGIREPEEQLTDVPVPRRKRKKEKDDEHKAKKKKTDEAAIVVVGVAQTAAVAQA